MTDFKKIEKKWQSKWEKSKIFQSEVDTKRKKYYIAIVYPYMSGLLHLGHLFTYMFSDVLSRYKRMNDFNVLIKFGFHCTGTPIVAAAQRVKEKESKQIESLKMMDIPKKLIPKFSNPEYWAEYFPKETLKDVKNMGFAIDERYVFKTTSLNPPYDKFIKWQFNKLKEKNLIKKGKHPVIWCAKCNAPTGDHARVEGEGEVPQEFILFKFKLKDGRYIITATLRHDTVWGITNVFVNPNVDYVEIETKGEKWIVGESIIDKLKNQEYDIKIKGKVKGKSLIGKKIESFGNKKILILPATFLDSNYGTGMVHSVPSDSADDLIALQELQKNDLLIKKYNLDPKEVKSIKPIEIFNTPKVGGNSAQYFLDKYEVKSQNEKKKLEKIKKELYKLTFTKSTFGSLYKKGFSKNLEGMSIPKGQEIIKKELLKKGVINTFYEPSGNVVCRCLTPCIVKIVSNQWFIEYNDPKWKNLAHKCLNKMKIYPEQVRKQLDYVIDWLNRWACVREFGLGTKLPWDKNWVIESLSDSTIQMAYNTISKYLQNPRDYGFKINKLNDEFFDYILLGKGKLESVAKSTGISKKLIKQMRKDFEYWYPFDFRNSAKDLIQNHLAFCIFNHVAIFSEKYWPKSYGLNGRIMVDNKKMSKSLGNFFTMRQLYKKYGADAVRLTSANAGEGIDDANYDMNFLKVAKKKLENMHSLTKMYYNKGRTNRINIDDWFESMINRCIRDTTENIENIKFKSAIQSGFLDMQRYLKWYLKRTGNKPNKKLINKFIEVQTKLITPVTPHICEEIWKIIGKKGFVSVSSWPKFDKKKINPKFEESEDFIIKTIDDIRHVLKLIKTKPKKVYLYSIPSEKKLLRDAKDFFEREFNLKFFIFSVSDKNIYDPQNKSKKAKLGKAGIYLE